jgi:predicted cupin superfamily sugar epimerase
VVKQKKMNVDDIIRDLALAPHPEGGFYRETYRSEETVCEDALPERFTGDRALSTAIYYLLKQGQHSAFHRIRSDEIWHFYAGSDLLIHVINEDGGYTRMRLCGTMPQAIVPAGSWFGAEPDARPSGFVNDYAATQTVAPTEDSFSLVGCTVAPGFDFEDFQLANTEDLCALCPDKTELIKKLTSCAIRG